MSKNNMAQRDGTERGAQQALSTLERQVLSLFNQLNEADRQHILRVLQALRDTPS